MFWIGLCLGISYSGVAQQRPVYSQYMFNGLALNPAYAGSQKQFNAMAVLRTQWVNLEGSPRTQMLSAHTPIPRKNVGVGLMLTHESIGVHTDWGAYASYAYQIKFKKQKAMLSLGLQGGVNVRASDYSKATYQTANDPLVDTYSTTSPNFGAGAYYSTKRAYVGFSVPFILENSAYDNLPEGAVTTGTESRYYYMTAGKVMPITDKVLVKPSVLVRYQENQPFGYDLSFNTYFNDVISVGASYRNGDAILVMAQMFLNENFAFGYAYDYTLSSLNTVSHGSHEVMLNYKILLSPEPCHPYF